MLGMQGSHHPVSKLSNLSQKQGWPDPVWEHVNEKVVRRHNPKLHTMKVTVWPGEGQVDPRVYFGSGPTKKEAKFACGVRAWADLETKLKAQQPLDTAAVNKPRVGLGYPL